MSTLTFSLPEGNPMRTLSHFLICSILIFCLINSAVGQDNGPAKATTTGLAVTASASSDRVRFTAPSSVVQIRLEVYDTKGRKVFDNEVRGGNMLDWLLLDGQGDRLSDDTYLCAVTIKSLSGKLTQRIASLTIEQASARLQALDVSRIDRIHLYSRSQPVGPPSDCARRRLGEEGHSFITSPTRHDGVHDRRSGHNQLHMRLRWGRPADPDSPGGDCYSGRKAMSYRDDSSYLNIAGGGRVQDGPSPGENHSLHLFACRWNHTNARRPHSPSRQFRRESRGKSASRH